MDILRTRRRCAREELKVCVLQVVLVAVVAALVYVAFEAWLATASNAKAYATFITPTTNSVEALQAYEEVKAESTLVFISRVGCRLAIFTHAGNRGTAIAFKDSWKLIRWDRIDK